MTVIRLPQYGMGMTDGTIVRWHVSPGDRVEKGQALCEVEAAKANVEFESPVSGTVTELFVSLDQNVPVDTPLLDVDEGGAETRTAPPQYEPADEIGATPLASRLAGQAGAELASVQGSDPNRRIRRDDVAGALSTPPTATVQIEPRARKAARDLNVDLLAVSGTGPNGRITSEDIMNQATSQSNAAASEATTTPALTPALEEPGFTEIKHSMMRRTIARRLTESKQTVPHFYLKANCRIDALLALRQEINAPGQEKVSVNDLIIRAIAVALNQVPEANVTWDDKAMRQYDHVDIAVAVATPRGLVTPVVRNVESKTIREIAANVKELAGRGRDGKLRPEEYQGGTTSVSNLGMFGVEEFSAIINPPQSTIFAVGAGEERVVPIDGKPGIATMMSVTMSVDHRAIDGAVGAQLLAAFKAIVENPLRIIA